MGTPEDAHDLYFVVAEDDADNHFRIRQAIKNRDPRFIVTSVFNGVQLLDLLMRRGYYQTNSYRAPDVIILDLQMHLMDGIEAMKEIRKEPSLDNIPVYTFTEINNDRIKNAALDLGAVEVFEMPDDLKDLDKIINRICEVEAKKKYGKRK